jgi:hypothetical protein
MIMSPSSSDQNHSLSPAVASGAACAWCLREFVAAHGKPVYCAKCYDNAFATRKSFELMPRAVHPLKG